jgi:hypothetical protein
VAVAPAGSDAYTVLLAISLVALITACVFLFLDYKQYPDKNPTMPPPPSAVKAPAAGGAAAAGAGAAAPGTVTPPAGR